MAFSLSMPRNSATISMVITSESESFGAGLRCVQLPIKTCTRGTSAGQLFVYAEMLTSSLCVRRKPYARRCKRTFIACKLHEVGVERGKENRWLKRGQIGAAGLTSSTTCNQA